MKYVIQKKYTDEEWSNFIHHPERENDWEDCRWQEAVEDSTIQYNTKEDAEMFLKFWNKTNHPKGILLRMVER